MSLKRSTPDDPEEDEAYSLAKYWDRRDDAELTCPYNMNHKIRRFRMERHLYLCKKNNPLAQVATCPYNATHVLPVKLYLNHVMGCPDIRLVDPDQGVVRSAASGARMVRTLIGSAQVSDKLFVRSHKEPLPSQRFSCLKETDHEMGFDSNNHEGPSYFPTTATASANPGDTIPVPGYRSTFQDSLALKEAMRNNFSSSERDGREFVENNIIVGGAPVEQSLYSCGGVAPGKTEDMEDDGSEMELEFGESQGTASPCPTGFGGEMAPPSISAPPARTLTTRERFQSLRAAAERNDRIRKANSASADSVRTA